MDIPHILLYALIVVYFATFWKLFERAGRKKWEGLIPVYNLWIWLKISGKPWWWILLFLVPGVNLLMLIIMNVNMSIIFGKREMKAHIMAVFIPWYTLPMLAFKDNAEFTGPIPKEERRRTRMQEWGDAILFAVIAATIIRTFAIEAFTIPTPSMEDSLLVGDFLFVSKLSYGPRMPMTPVAFPFAHHTLPLTRNTKSYLDWFSMPYQRLPGFGSVERHDAVVFNFPEGDTVVLNFQNRSYYQMEREIGADKIWDPRTRLPAALGPNGQVIYNNVGEIAVRPLDKRENYIKRCVGLPGDNLEVRDGEVYIDGKQDDWPEGAMFKWQFELSENFLLDYLKYNYNVDPQDLESDQIIKQMDGKLYTVLDPIIALSKQMAEKIKVDRAVISLEPMFHIPGKEPSVATPIYPNNAKYNWSRDFFGPIWIPKAGESIELSEENLPIYERAIGYYEGNDLEVKDGRIFINGAETNSYTFKLNYYWMMGDNRHNSQDSRFWGFVPETHIVGKAVFIWLSNDPEEGGFPFGIRWKRLFSLVR